MADLASIERACQCVLGGVGTPQERAAAQQRVLELGTSIGNITLIQAILDGSNDNYAIAVAAQSLLRLVTGELPSRQGAGAGPSPSMTTRGSANATGTRNTNNCTSPALSLCCL